MSTSPHPFLLSDLRRESRKHEKTMNEEPLEPVAEESDARPYHIRTIVAGGKLQYVILRHGRTVVRNFSRLSSGGSTAALWKACARKAKLQHPEDPNGRAANQQAALDFTLISRELKLNGNGST